jgi:cyclopropane fatty-acyl-phospholipid synthase-like methyltransferase
LGYGGTRAGMGEQKHTDWTAYYTHPYVTARYSRAITRRLLVRLIRKHLGREARTVVEVGGANSCFYDFIVQELGPADYHVIDNNEYGLSLLQARARNGNLVVHQEDALHLSLDLRADVVFSFGFIEHFPVAGTRQVVKTHFDLLNEGGIAVIGFPSPTWLYRCTRFLSEKMGMWIFHDERPSTIEEIRAMVGEWGEVLDEMMVWPMFLTQGVIVARRKPDPHSLVAEPYTRD